MTESARLPDVTESTADGADAGAEALAEGARLAEVEAWCARLPEDQRAAIERLRAQVRAVAPEAHEGIHYRVPTFFLDGPLVALTVDRSQLTLITMRPRLLESLRVSLRGVSVSGSTMRTPLAQPFPDEALRDVVLARAHQNATGT
jgi:uncharacterized protein YdhG (YjbR/CyaY superfamily)